MLMLVFANIYFVFGSYFPDPTLRFVLFATAISATTFIVMVSGGRYIKPVGETLRATFNGLQIKEKFVGKFEPGHVYCLVNWANFIFSPRRGSRRRPSALTPSRLPITAVRNAARARKSSISLARRGGGFGRAGGHLDPGLAVEHDLARDAAAAGEARPAPLRDELGDGDLDLDGVADAHRGAEVERLADVDRAGARKPCPEHRRDQARSVEPVRDPRPERRLCREMLRQMDRVAVAGHLGEADDVGGRDGLRQRLRHADGEVLEVEHAQLKEHPGTLEDGVGAVDDEAVAGMVAARVAREIDRNSGKVARLAP